MTAFWIEGRREGGAEEEGEEELGEEEETWATLEEEGCEKLTAFSLKQENLSLILPGEFVSDREGGRETGQCRKRRGLSCWF